MVPVLRRRRPVPRFLPAVTVLLVLVSLLGLVATGPATGAAGATGGTLTVRAKGSTGREIMEVRVGGVVAGRFGVSRSWADYRVTTGSAAEAPGVEVAFVNDSRVGGDNNLQVDRVAFAGRLHQVEDRSVVGTGVWEHGARCRPGRHRSEQLACNGRFVLGDLPWGGLPPTTSTTSSPASTTTRPPASTTTRPPASTTTRPPATTTSRPPATTTSRPPATTTTARSGAATGRFYVVGTDIVGPDGRIFAPIGANVAIRFTPYGYVFEGNNGGVNDRVADIEAWNWNTVRATLICDNDSGVPTMAELVDGIDPTIRQLTAAGIVVILECHDATGSDLALGSAKDLRVREFWDTMAARYRDNPYVWFNIYNEPYASADTAGWARLHQFHIDRIRATGAENIIVADLPVWGQGIDLVGTSSFADAVSASCNTVLGWHAYGAIAGQQGSLADHEAAIRAAQAKDMALLVGEYGVALPADWGNAGPWQWNITGFEAMNVLGPRYGIGLLWWHATGDQAYFSLYSLKADRSGFWTADNSGNLSPYGQEFWNVSQAAPADRGHFRGDLADSGCPSAG